MNPMIEKYNLYDLMISDLREIDRVGKTGSRINFLFMVQRSLGFPVIEEDDVEQLIDALIQRCEDEVDYLYEGGIGFEPWTLY